MKKLPLIITIAVSLTVGVASGLTIGFTTANAKVTPETINYTVSFKNYDGSLLSETVVEKGKTAIYTGQTPTRAETIECRYTFIGWDQSLENITSDCVRVAQFNEELKPVTHFYQVTFKNYDGNLLQEVSVKEGETAIYSGQTPTRPSTPTHTYTFDGWDLPLSNITSDCVRVAQFKEIQTKFTVTFENYDGTELFKTYVLSGSDVTYQGNTPTKPDTAEFEYEFIGWDKPLTNITTDTIFVAQYSETKKYITPTYIVTFKNYDDSILQQVSVLEGASATYGGQTPTRPSNSEYEYEFVGWDESLDNITSDCVRVAQYSQTSKEYTVRFYNDSELLYIATVHYQEAAVYHGVTPTKESTATHYYTFVGWNKDISCITESMDVQAVFSEHGDDKHVILNPNNGQENSQIEVTFDEQYDLGTPSFPGFIFLGWYADETPIPTTGVWQYSGVSSVKAKWQNVYFIFTENEDHTYTVSLNNEGKAAKEIVIPSVYEGIQITAMGENFAKSNTNIEKVTIPGSIKNIPDYSFSHCTNLKEVTLNEGLISIGKLAFEYCSFYKLIIPSSCTTIGLEAFQYNSSLYHVYIPKSVTSMGDYTFYSIGTNAYICLEHEAIPSNWNSNWSSNTNYINCQKLVEGEDFNYVIRSYYGDLSVVILRLTEATKQLQNYTVPTEIEGISDIRIGRYVFKNNKYIRSIDLTGVTRIYLEAFSGCSNLNSVTFSNSLVAIENKAFQSCSSLLRLEIPSSCTEIMSFAFDSCSSLSYIYIPSTTTTIGQYAFDECGSAIIYTNAHAKSSGWDTNWTRTQSVYYDYVSNNETDDFNYVVQTYMGDDYVTITSVKSSAKAKKNIVIPNEIEGISDIRLKTGLFNAFNELVSINLGQGVKSIPSNCFRDCTKLESVILGNNVKNIYSYAFYNCTKLSSVNIPDTLTTIDNYSFAYCTSLREIRIPISVSTIGDYAFYNTARLVFLIESNIAQSGWSSSWYGNSSTNKSLIYSYVSNGVIGDFKYAKTFDGAIETIFITGLTNESTNLNLVVPDVIEGITNIKISSYAFYGNKLIKSIDLGNSVTAINGYAFAGNTSLRSVIIPLSCTVIRNNAFQSCDSSCKINCEATSKPDGWETNWNPANCQVEWEYVRP